MVLPLSQQEEQEQAPPLIYQKGVYLKAEIFRTKHFFGQHFFRTKHFFDTNFFLECQYVFASKLTYV